MKKRKKVYDEFGRDNSFISCAKWVYCWIVFNPLIYPLLVLLFRKHIIAHACNMLEKRCQILWPFVIWSSCHSGDANLYWFHYYTKLKYASIGMQVMVVCKTMKEDDFYQFYSDKNVNHQVKRFCFWNNNVLSEDFRIHMIKQGFQPNVADFKYVLETGQHSVVKEIVKQTISDEFCVLFWEKAIENDAVDMLSVFVDYIVREGLTPRLISYVTQSHDCIAKKVALKALETHRAVAFIKRSRPNEVFRELLLKGVKLPYEAQCYLTVPLYKIYKETHYELGEKAIMYHLKKEGDMAKEILNEQRDFSSDVLGVIMKSPILTAWYRSRT